jgi:hypothetical protein
MAHFVFTCPATAIKVQHRLTMMMMLWKPNMKE